jgi:hypothetical protein
VKFSITPSSIFNSFFRLEYIIVGGISTQPCQRRGELLAIYWRCVFIKVGGEVLAFFCMCTYPSHPSQISSIYCIGHGTFVAVFIILKGGIVGDFFGGFGGVLHCQRRGELLAIFWRCVFIQAGGKVLAFFVCALTHLLLLKPSSIHHLGCLRRTSFGHVYTLKEGGKCWRFFAGVYSSKLGGKCWRFFCVLLHISSCSNLLQSVIQVVQEGHLVYTQRRGELLSIFWRCVFIEAGGKCWRFFVCALTHLFLLKPPSIHYPGCSRRTSRIHSKKGGIAGDFLEVCIH